MEHAPPLLVDSLIGSLRDTWTFMHGEMELEKKAACRSSEVPLS